MVILLRKQEDGKNMKPTIFRMSLDIHKIHSQLTIPIKRGDTSGKLVITLMQSGKPYEITEDCYAKFTAAKDRSGVIMDHPCIIQNNTSSLITINGNLLFL